MKVFSDRGGIAGSVSYRINDHCGNRHVTGVTAAAAALAALNGAEKVLDYKSDVICQESC